MKIEYMNGSLTYRKQKTEFMKIYLIEVEWMDGSMENLKMKEKLNWKKEIYNTC